MPNPRIKPFPATKFSADMQQAIIRDIEALRTSVRKIFFLTAFFLVLSSSVALAQETKVFFSPQGGCQEAVISQMSKARSTVNIAMYYLTSPDIAQEIVKVKKRGATVKIFLDKSQRGQKSSQLEYLTSEGIAVRIYEKSGLMHNKFAILDNKVLITGSFNWTLDAENNNQENLLIITDKRLVGLYAKQFERLWVQGKDEEAHKSLQRQTKEISRYLIKILKQIITALMRQLKW